jgi:hypothetical protein
MINFRERFQGGLQDENVLKVSPDWHILFSADGRRKFHAAEEIFFGVSFHRDSDGDSGVQLGPV